MAKHALFGVVLALVAGCASRPAPAVTDPEARAVIEKAIVAQGGEARLSQFSAARWKGRGSLTLNGQTLPLTAETVYQLPDKYKTAMHFEVQGKNVGGVQVMDGDAGWMSAEGKTLNLEGELLKALREEFYSANVEMLVPLIRDEGYTLSKLPETQVDGKPAVGVKVSRKDHKDIELYFDRDSSLPVKTVRPTLDPLTMKEISAEVLYSGVKEYDGVMWPTRMVVNQNGKRFMELTITEFKKLDKLDPSEFARPK